MCMAEDVMALKEKTNSFLSHMLGDWEWYRGMPDQEIEEYLTIRSFNPAVFN